MAYYIDKAKFVGEVLTSSEQQLKFRGMTGEEAYFEALRLVNDMPAADVAEVRHGRWIRVDSTKCKCSECDAVAFIAQYPPSADKNYCPNCGCAMEVNNGRN